MSVLQSTKRPCPRLTAQAAKKAAKETQKLEQKDKKEKKKEKENKKRKAEQVTNGVEDADKEETEAKKQKQDDETDRGDAAGGGTAAKAFQRVKDEEWLNKKGAWDNSYEGTFGSSGWGFKAQQILGKVRGKDFRHEKTKKKRGSYKGGEINSHAICSYKFESDDE